MRKLIEKQPDSTVVCDNPKCDFTVPYNPIDEQNILSYLNKPCPKCGENLLTPEDYIQYLKMMKVVDWINKWFSWITLFTKNSKIGQNIYSAHVHDGIKIKKES